MSLLLNRFLQESINNKKLNQYGHTTDSIHISILFEAFPPQGKRLQSASADRWIGKSWCQSCLQVTLFAGSDNKLASVTGCQTECHNAGSTAASHVIKVAAKLMQRAQEVDCDLIRNALAADQFYS